MDGEKTSIVAASNFSSSCIMIYEEAGLTGRAQSTIRGKESAMKHYEAFLASMNLVYEECSESVLVNESMFRQYGTYLIDFAERLDGSDVLRRDSANQYFSGAVNTLKKLYKDNNLWRTGSWLADVRQDIHKLITRRCIVEGKEVKDKSKGVGRLVMIDIGAKFFTTDFF